MMTRQLIRTNKRLLILFVFGVMTVMYSSAQTDLKKRWYEIYGDTILELSNPFWGGRSLQITEAIHKAIDPRLIANKYGIVIEDKNNLWSVRKRFAIFIYDGVFPGCNADSSPISGDHKKWDYYINDENMSGAGRALISAIMPQAIESIDFTPPSPKDLPKILSERLWRDSINKGAIRLYTRDISKSAINDSATVYLLNDNKVITRKIYDALNPVFIRSLKRITNPEELADYGYKGKTEIVKIELFESNDLTVAIVVSDECQKCRVTLLDNIQIDRKIYNALHYFHIKEIREITEDDKKAFAPYSKLFTKEKLVGGKSVTIITL